MYIHLSEYKENKRNHGNSSAFNQLLETLLLAIKMCSGSTTDRIWVNEKGRSVTSEPGQSSSRRVSSFEESSALLIN